MANNNPIKVDLDRFENNIKDIREVSREIIADNTVCDEPAKFIADNPIIQDYCDFHNEILDLLKTFKKENELFTDRLSEIGENYRAMNDTATQRISADKVEHNAMPVSSKTQTGSSLNAPVSSMPKLEGGFRASYKTGDAKVDAEVDALFDEYGEDLSGLIGCPLTVWDEFSETRKKALAQIYYTDMNLVTTQYPANAVRLNAILTMLQSTETYSTKAFDQDKLDELDRLIPKGSSNARSLIGLMKQMNQSQVAGFDGYNHISIEQTIEGIRFVLSDGMSESDIGEEIGFYKYPIDLYADYLTEDEAVNNEIKTLFLNYGEDLYGLAYEALNQPAFGCISDYWDNLSIEKRKAIARVFYIDMNRIIDERSDDVERVESILTLFQNGGDATGMAFNVDDLNELKGLIYGNGNIFMDVEKKLSYAGYDSTLDVLEKMATMPVLEKTDFENLATMPVHNGLPQGPVKIRQTSSGVTFSIVVNISKEINTEKELGLYFDQARSKEYLNNILNFDPNAFSHFMSITGMDMEEAADYICTCVNSDDLYFMTGLLQTDDKYQFIIDSNPPSFMSCGTALKFADYTNILLGLSMENGNDSVCKQEYINVINAILENQSSHEDLYPDEFENMEGYRTLLDLICTYSLIDSDMENRIAWATANLEVRNELGLESQGGISIDRDEIEKRLAVVNMNATVWTRVTDYYSSLNYGADPKISGYDLWDSNKIELVSLSGGKIECFNGDYNQAQNYVGSAILKEAYADMIEDESMIPMKMATDVATAFLTATCPEFGIPASLIAALAFNDSKGAIGTVAKGAGEYSDSKICNGSIDAVNTLVNGGIDLCNLDKKYEEQVEQTLNDYLFNFGGSYTANGIRVIEYANMCELLRMNYMGVNELYGLGIDDYPTYDADNEEDKTKYGKILKGVKEKFSTIIPILDIKRQKYSDNEIESAVNLILFGSDCSTSDKTGNDSVYKNIFEIPVDLRYQCFYEISDKAQYYPGSTSKQIDMITEFNKATGNIFVSEGDD